MRTEKTFSKTLSLITVLLLFYVSGVSASSPNITDINPTNNSVISGNIWINSTVTDPDGYQISKASFRLNSSSGNLTAWRKFNGTDGQYYSRLNTSNFSDGVYNLSVRATATNSDTGYNLITNLTVNNIPEQDEDIFVQNPVPNQTVNSTINVNASYSGPKTEYNRSFRWMNASGNQSKWLEFNTTYNTTGLADGSYWLFFNMTDQEGTFLTENVSGIQVRNNQETNKTSPPVIEVISPSENTKYRGKVPLTVSVTDEDRIVSRSYRLEGKYGKTSWKKLNDTLRPGEVLSGRYNLTLKAVDSDKNDSDTYTALRNITLDYQRSKLEENCCRKKNGLVDDFSVSTRSETNISVLFHGDLLKSREKNLFNISGPLEGQEVSYAGRKSLDTSKLEPGRYSYITGNSSARVDVMPSSDVAGRIPQNTEINLRYWKNGTQVPPGAYNVSVRDWYDGSIYMLNISLDSYWIIASGSNWSRNKASLQAPGKKYSPPKPRINDIKRQNASITGNVIDEKGKPIENTTLVLERLIPGLDRKPYITAPVTKTSVTGSSGNFRFDNLSPGTYRIKSGKDSKVRKNLIELNKNLSSFIRVENKHVDAGNITLNSEIGTLRVDMEGPSDLYSILAEGLNSKYYRTGFKPSFKNTLTLPEGNYRVKTYLFRQKGAVESRENTLKIKKGEETVIRPEFTKNVEIKGRITEGGKPLSGKSLIVRNSSKRLKYVTETDENGNYSVKVRNRTWYTIKTSDSQGRWTSEKIKAGKSGRKDFIFQKGVNLSGKILSEGVKQVFIEKNGFSLSRRAKPYGGYIFRGLNRSTEYTVGIKDFLGASYSRKVSTGSENQRLNLSFERPDYNLTLNVSGYRKDSIPVELSLENSRKKITSSSNSGYFKLENLSSSRYSLSLSPQNSSYRSQDFFISLDSDKNLEIELKPLAKVKGKLKGIPEPDSIRFVSSEGFWSFDLRKDNVFTGKVPPGVYTVKVEGEGGSDVVAEKLDVPVSGLEKNFSLQNNRYISGEVASNYTGLEDGYVLAERVEGKEVKYSRLSDGVFNITGLGNVSYRIMAVSNGSRIAGKKVNLSKGSNQVTLVDETPGDNRLEVMVTDNSGNPLEDTEVLVSGREGKTDSQGIIEFSGLEDGLKTVKARKEGYNVSEQSVNVTLGDASFFENSDEKVEADISLDRNVEKRPVKIKLRDTGNNPVRGASVVFDPESPGRTYSGLTDSSGETFIDDLEAGNYTATVLKKDRITTDVGFTGRDSTFDIGSMRLEVITR